jgi:hypothetical protein
MLQSRQNLGGDQLQEHPQGSFNRLARADKDLVLAHQQASRGGRPPGFGIAEYRWEGLTAIVLRDRLEQLKHVRIGWHVRWCKTLAGTPHHLLVAWREREVACAVGAVR